MICNNCGMQVTDGIESCPYCNTTYIYTAAPVNPVAQRFNAVFSEKKFLAVGVITAIVAGLNLMSGTVDILSLLFAIFTLTTYSNAKKGTLTPNHLRNTSGCVFACRIVNWVVSGLFGLAGIGMLGFGIIGAAGSFASKSDYGYETAAVAGVGSVMFIVYGVIFIFLAAVLLLSNILFYSPAHRFAKQLYTNLSYGYEGEYKVGLLRFWTIFRAIMGILSLLFAVGVIAVLFFGVGLSTFGIFSGDMMSSGEGVAIGGGLAIYSIFMGLFAILYMIAFIPSIIINFMLASWLKTHFS